MDLYSMGYESSYYEMQLHTYNPSTEVDTSGYVTKNYTTNMFLLRVIGELYVTKICD